jgi:hypothetical protein
LARGTAYVLTGGTLLLVLTLRVSEGTTFPFEGLAVSVARIAAWTVASCLALAAANGVGEASARDGISWMAMSRGASLPTLTQARFLAVAWEIAWWVALPAVTAALAAVASAGSVESALRRLGLCAVALAFATMTGLLVGAVAVAADTLRPRGGRSVLLALLLLPWIFSSLLDFPHASLPGALEAFLQAALGAVGLGRFA